MVFCLHICFNFSTAIIFLFIFSPCILGIFLLSRHAISSSTVLLNISKIRLWMVSQKLPNDVFPLSAVEYNASRLNRMIDCVFIMNWICENWSSQEPDCPVALCHHQGKFKHFFYFIHRWSVCFLWLFFCWVWLIPLKPGNSDLIYRDSPLHKIFNIFYLLTHSPSLILIVFTQTVLIHNEPNQVSFVIPSLFFNSSRSELAFVNSGYIDVSQHLLPLKLFCFHVYRKGNG